MENFVLNGKQDKSLKTQMFTRFACNLLDYCLMGSQIFFFPRS